MDSTSPQVMISIVFAHKMASRLFRKVLVRRQIKACLRTYIGVTLWVARTLPKRKLSNLVLAQAKQTKIQEAPVGVDSAIIPDIVDNGPLSGPTQPNSARPVAARVMSPINLLKNKLLRMSLLRQKRKMRRIVPIAEQLDDLLHPDKAKEKKAKLMEQSALKIQTNFRRFQAKQKVRAMRMVILTQKVVLIQRWYRYRKWKRVRQHKIKSATLIQSTYKAVSQAPK